jgi:hypothetical protein
MTFALVAWRDSLEWRLNGEHVLQEEGIADCTKGGTRGPELGIFTKKWGRVKKWGAQPQSRPSSIRDSRRSDQKLPWGVLGCHKWQPLIPTDP